MSFNRPTTLGGEIGFCYIDGNQTYEFAKRDFENTHRALVPGGFKSAELPLPQAVSLVH